MNILVTIMKEISLWLGIFIDWSIGEEAIQKHEWVHLDLQKMIWRRHFFKV